MKKFVLAIIALVATAATVSAQEQGEWSVAPKFNIYTNTGDGVVLGLGAGMRYSITDAVRIEPSFIYMLDNNSALEIACDVHYVFDVADRWNVYPMAGLTANNIYGWSSGVNLGAGVDFAISDSWDITAAVKWQPMFSDDRTNPVLIQIGGSFKF